MEVDMRRSRTGESGGESLASLSPAKEDLLDQDDLIDANDCRLEVQPDRVSTSESLADSTAGSGLGSLFARRKPSDLALSRALSLLSLSK